MATEPQDWQSGLPLGKACGYMFNNQVGTDVRFVVGESKTTIKAHKFILMCRSSVFQSMLSGDFADDKSDIEVPDIDADTFSTMLVFLYTDVAEVNGDNALSLLYASKKYAIQQLVHACLTFLTDGQSTDNACSVFEQAHFYNEDEFRTRSMTYICENASAVLRSPGFLELCHDCVKTVVSSDNLQCDERVVLEAVTKWAEHQCDKAGKDHAPEILRDVLGEILYLVRFPTLDKDYFTNVLSDSLILNDAEKVELFKYFYKSNSEEVPKFFITRKREFANVPKGDMTKRKNSGLSLAGLKDNASIQTCIRFTSVSEDEGWYCGTGEPDAIAFHTNVDVFMHGILVYGSYIGEGRYDVQTVVRGSADSELVRQTSHIKTSEYQLTYAILFDQALFIKKNQKYIVSVQLGDADTYKGKNGSSTVNTENGVTFTFYKTRYSVNGTDVRSGQIPGILFSAEK